MKVSAAIRKGSQGKEQAFGEFIDSAGAVCALGAAVLGVAPDTDDICFTYVVDDLLSMAMADTSAREWHEVVIEAGCPSEDDCILEDDTTLERLITHLNDMHHWTFAQIADWLEGIGL